MRHLTVRLVNNWARYCSITVAKHDETWVIRFVSKSYTHPWKKFANRLHLVLHADVRFFMQTWFDRYPNMANNWVRPTAGARRPPRTRRRAPARATRVLHRAPRRHVTGWQRGTVACAGTRVLALSGCARFLARTLFEKIISHMKH